MVRQGGRWGRGRGCFTTSLYQVPSGSATTPATAVGRVAAAVEVGAGSTPAGRRRAGGLTCSILAVCTTTGGRYLF